MDISKLLLRSDIGPLVAKSGQGLESLVEKLSRRYVGRFSDFEYSASTYTELLRWLRGSFPWFDLARLVTRSNGALNLAHLLLLRGKGNRDLIARGLTEMVSIQLLARYKSSVASSKVSQVQVKSDDSAVTRGAAFPTKHKVFRQLEDSDSISLPEGETPAELGAAFGWRLAHQYLAFSNESRDTNAHLSPHELLSDADKDLRAQQLSKEIPARLLERLNASGKFGDFIFEMRSAALESLLDVLVKAERNDQEKRRTSMPSAHKATPTIPASQKPKPTLHIDPTSFEAYCAEWSRYLGFADAEVTRAVKDGGFDIHSTKMVAQCKLQEVPVGVRPIRELHGVAVSQGKVALFFSVNGYSREAIQEANRFKMQLWTVRPFEGRVFPASEADLGMNQGDYHSGPEGYDPNTAYPDSQYGSIG